jgi:predicted ATPase
MVEVRVAPKKKSRVVTLADVGYGVSQILPLLSLDAQLSAGKLLAYQPEAHLHPLAQSRLADVFVASVKRGNRVYVETHSEHLVLRLQALIAGGEIEPDRVRVFCVEHDGEKSNVEAMTFDQRGVPETRWPKGFLDTGLDLARDLAERRHSRTQRRERGGG